MKKDSAEGAAVFGVVQRVALSHPEVSVKFLRDGKQELLIRKNVPGSWSIVPAELLRDPLESANPGAGMVSFTVPAPETGNVELEVTLTPL